MNVILLHIIVCLAIREALQSRSLSQMCLRDDPLSPFYIILHKRAH